MTTTTVLLIIAGAYCLLLFFDTFFKSCALYPYLKLLDGLGLKISYFTLKWKSKAFNRLILKWGNARPQFLKLWFLLGIYTTLALLPIAICILFYSIFEIIFKHNFYDSPPLVTPVIPGLNLPASELGYYSITILICSIVHELGHALAAVLEDLSILKLGCNIYFIFPVAFVSISTEKLSTISFKKRLGIFCAGVWHNVFLSFIFYLLYYSLPSLFSPFYNTGDGVSVTHINKNSPILGPNGLLLNDVISEINNCKIRSQDDWFLCLNNNENLLPAVCIESDIVNTLDESVPLKHGSSGYVECCDSSNTKNLCFEYIDLENNELELPGHACLPGRVIMEKSANFCTTKPHVCPSNFYCFKPILPNNTFIFKIVTSTKNVIYLGHPNDLYQTIQVSSYISKSNTVSVALPDIITKFARYVVVVSLGLAFINVLPIMYMDGEYILQMLGFIVLKTKFGKKKTVLAVSVTTWMFTLTIIFYLVYSVFKLL